MSTMVRSACAAVLVAALVVSGGSVHAVERPVTGPADIQQQILDRVRAAAAPAARASATAVEEGAWAEATLEPGEGAVLDADAAGVRAEFSGHEVDEKLAVRAVALDDGAAVSAASETGGVVSAPPVEIRAHTEAGEDVTHFPASYTLEKDDSSGIEVAKNVRPGVSLQLDVDPDSLTRSGVDLDSLRVVTRENPGAPWTQLPSYYDADARVVRAESEHLSQFVVIGTPAQTTPVPRIVLDPDDDAGWANSPGPRITELPLNVRLADQMAGMFRERCAADVTITRGADQRFVSAQTRRAIAASHNPDVTLTVAFGTNQGAAWGNARNGGTQLFSRGGDSDALRDSLLSEMRAYTGRPGRVKAPTADFPREEYQGLPGAVVHMEALYMDHNFDRPVIDSGWDSIVNGAFTGVGKYLESKGFSCTNPITGGWPARPSAAELSSWYQLGYRNWQHYGADPVSFSTGNLVETEHFFSLPGAGGAATDVSLVYNAQDGRLGRVGAGWNFALGGHAQRFDDHSVMVVRGDGASIMFEPDGTGGYTDPRGEGLHLVEAGGGTLRMSSRTGETWDFDAADQDGIGEMTRAVDAAGRATTLSYGTPSRTQQFVPLTSITDASGQRVRVDSDDAGRITALTLPDGRAWSLGYDGNGDLTRIASPDGGAKSFAYDGSHRIVTMTDALGATYLRNAYDNAGRVVQQWDAAGIERHFVYQAGQTTYTDQEGRTHVYAFDSQSRITTITDPAGGEQSWTYDDDNNVTAFTDAAGRTTSYAYDAAGNVTGVTDAAGNTTAYTYTPKGTVASRTDALGRVTSYGYNDRGALTKTVQADGSVINYDVDGSGNVVRTTLPSGAAYAFEVDGRGNRVASTDPLGRTTRFAYDDGNRLIASTDPLGRVTRYAWDARDKLAAVTDALGRVSRFAYDLNGNLTSATDPAGNATRYTWDALFRIVSATDATGGTTSYTYDNEDGLTGTTDAAGRQTRFVLDVLARPVETIDPAGRSWKQSFDASGVPVTQTDPRGAETKNEVDALGRVTSTKGPTSVVQSNAYDAVGRVSSVADGAGNTTTYEYDALDHVTSVVDPTGRRAGYTYNADGQVVGTTDRLGNTTLYERDAAGQLAKITNADGTTSYAYDAAGQLVSVTDPTGRTRTSTYDAAGQITESMDAAGNTTRYEHDVLGNVVAVTDPDGSVTRATWDAAGRRTSVTNALGESTTFTYDTAGQLTSTTDALGHASAYTYEEHGQLATVTDPTGGVTRYAYDELGVLAAVTDARGNQSAYENNALGQPVTVTDPAGGRTRYEYDRRGMTSRVVAPSGAAVSYGYDARGDRTEQASVSDVVRFEYDAEQRVIAASNAHGTTGWTYTPTGQMASQIDQQGRELSYAYDRAGALTQLTVPGGQKIDYERDAAGRVSRMSSPWGSAVYGYDKTGNLTGIDRSNGVTTRYGYDAARQVTAITSTTPPPASPVAGPAVPGAVRTQGLCPVVTNENASGLRASTVDKPGCSTVSSYLGHRSLPSDTGSLPQGATLSLGYGYDAAGNVTEATRTATAPTSALPGGVAPAGAFPGASDASTTVLDKLATTYAYDNGNRLTRSAQSTGGTDDYAYDQVGNRTGWSHSAATSSSGVLDPVLMVDASGASVPRPPASLATGSVKATDTSFQQTQEFNNLNQLVSATGGPAGAQTYAYDADGHRTSVTGGGSGATYRWNELGQLTGYTDSSGSTRFDYDALSRRVSTTTDSAHGSVHTSTVWNGLQPVQDVSDVAGTTTLVRDVAGELLLEGRTSGAATWDLLDRLGSAIAQVGDTRLGSSLNNPVQSARDALTDRTSRITQVSGGSDWGVPSFSTSGWNASVGHSGERADPVAGLSLFYSRGYDSRSGSWLSRDSWEGVLESPASLNGYAYVEGNPVTSRDLLGYRPLGRYDWADGNSVRPRFTAPGVWSNTGARTQQSSYSPSKTFTGYPLKPKIATPKAASQPTARHSAGSVGLLSPSVPLLSAWAAAAAESAAAAAAAAGLVAAGAATGMLLFSLSGDSSGVGVRRNDAAGPPSDASAEADSRSRSGSPNCDPESFFEYSCPQGNGFEDANSSRPPQEVIKGEAANYDVDELAQFARGHSGDGWANGQARPSLAQIEAALRNGTPFRRPGQDGLVFDFKNTRVIINENNPFKSTGFFKE